MQIKKFIAPTLKEASSNMKMELGDEAVILGTRVIYNDTLNRPQRNFEITAGIEDEFNEPVLATQIKEKRSNTAEKNYSNEISKLRNKIFINPAPGNKTLLRGTSTPTKAEPTKKIKNNIETELKEIIDTLINREVQKPIISSIINQLKKFRSYLHSSNIDSYVLSSIASMIPTYHFEVNKRNKPKVVAMVGPTGVGKTTCIAKLAVISKILHNLNVGLISIDTYRLGALDQLRIFSEISNVDMLVAYEPKDIPGLLNSLKDKDIIFIDTAGRSQNNKEHLLQANKFLSAAKVDETYLVLSSTSTTKNLLDVSEKFKILNYNSVIFTKIDEAVSYGNILNIVNNFDIPLSFLTNGQVIPDDIISADPEYIANMVYTGKLI
ncbi:MAG TPA: flagellar biosynthesis protein FlhF [Ignavibacteria bacterium]|nr:flagellar biosynthesis protein FlhF [Ignavibacteria bacterium]